MPEGQNPDGNERLTAAVGLVLIVLTVVELGTLLLGLDQFLSLHVFVGLVLIPLVLLKMASTAWRFTRYYTRSEPYRLKGAPQIVMRMLAPLFLAATVVLFASGVAMGILHGHALAVARNLHGPASVIWLVLVGVHVLVYFRRALVSSREDLEPTSRAEVRGARARTYVIVAAIVAGLVLGLATFPVRGHWLHAHRHDRGEATVRSGSDPQS
jgi:hypothetical protein